MSEPERVRMTHPDVDQDIYVREASVLVHEAAGWSVDKASKKVTTEKKGA